MFKVQTSELRSGAEGMSHEGAWALCTFMPSALGTCVHYPLVSVNH